MGKKRVSGCIASSPFLLHPKKCLFVQFWWPLSGVYGSFALQCPWLLWRRLHQVCDWALLHWFSFFEPASYKSCRKVMRVEELYNLGGGFKHFLFSPRNLREIINFGHKNIFQLGWVACALCSLWRPWLTNSQKRVLTSVSKDWRLTLRLCLFPSFCHWAFLLVYFENILHLKAPHSNPQEIVAPKNLPLKKKRSLEKAVCGKSESGKQQEAERSRADTTKRCAGGEEAGIFPRGRFFVIAWLRHRLAKTCKKQLLAASMTQSQWFFMSDGFYLVSIRKCKTLKLTVYTFSRI